MDIKADLTFAIQDNFSFKHLSGQHDQSTHGSWAGDGMVSTEKIREHLNQAFKDLANIDHKYWILDKSRPKKGEGYEYRYYSEKPLGKFENSFMIRSENDHMIYSKKPLSPRAIYNLKLIPVGNATKADAIMRFWEAAYGKDAPITLSGKRDTYDPNALFTTITPNTQNVDWPWRNTWINKSVGVTGHTTAKTKLQALTDAIESGYSQIVPPEEVDKIFSKSLKHLSGQHDQKLHGRRGGKKIGEDSGLYSKLHESTGIPLAKDEIINLVIEKFGLTNNPREAGYMLDDGRMLDFSGRSNDSSTYVKIGDFWKPRKGERDYLMGERQTDHREVVSDTDGNSFVWKSRPKRNDQYYDRGDDDMSSFMAFTGAARMSVNTGGLYINVNHPFSEKQSINFSKLAKGKSVVTIDAEKNGVLEEHAEMEYPSQSEFGGWINAIQRLYQDETTKHLRGQHDQKRHGRWAGGKIREDSRVYSDVAKIREAVLSNPNITEDDREGELKSKNLSLLKALNQAYRNFDYGRKEGYEEHIKSLQNEIEANETEVDRIQENNAKIMHSILSNLPQEKYTGKATVSAAGKSIHQPTPENTKEILDHVNRVLDCVDTLEWKDYPKFVRVWMTNIGGASYYDEEKNRIHIGYESDSGIPGMGQVAVHELGHWIENRKPYISRKAEEIFRNRLFGEAKEKSREHGYQVLADDLIETNYIVNRKGQQIPQYRYYPDKFMDEYMGRIYNTSTGIELGREFFSTSLAYLFYNPKKFAREDPEMFEFTVRALTGK